MKELKKIEVRLHEVPDKQISLTDRDARSMKTRGTGIVGYNVQTAVDAKHHLMVAHEVTNVGIDRDQLSSMAKQAREAVGTQELTAVADRGYFKSEEILACHEAGITVIVPKTATSNATDKGRFGKADFIYDAEKNEYRCPAGERLIWRFSSIEHGLKFHRYWSSHCQTCAMKGQCTPSKQRRGPVGSMRTSWKSCKLAWITPRLDLDPCYLAMGETEQQRQRRYAAFVSQDVRPSERLLFREALQRGQLTGTERFVDEIERKLGVRVERRGRGRPAKSEK
jgi:Transposase DDE domain.